MQEIVIPREKAVFWLDEHGVWQNAHGRFQNPRIIAHFNASIARDENGYYLSQINGDRREKVYFPYADTVYFAVDLDWGPPIALVLNTGDQLPLDPRALFIQNDNLYMRQADGERIKFNDRSLVKLSRILECDGKDCLLRLDHQRWLIPGSD